MKYTHENPFMEAFHKPSINPFCAMSSKSAVHPPFTMSQAAGDNLHRLRVINASSSVSDDTRERVQKAIDRLAFVPKAEARARAMKDFARIGVLTPFFTAPAFVQRLRGVAQGLLSTRYELTIFTIESLDHLNYYQATLPVTGHLEGLIMLSLRVNDESDKKLKDHGLKRF